MNVARHPERIDWSTLLSEPVRSGEHLADHVVEHACNDELRLRQTFAGRLYIVAHKHPEFLGAFSWSFVIALLLGIGGVSLSLPAWLALAVAFSGGGAVFGSVSLWPVVIMLGDGERSPLFVRAAGSPLRRRVQILADPTSAWLELCEETGGLVARDENDRMPILLQLHGGMDGLAGMLATHIAVARCASAIRSLAAWQGADELMPLEDGPPPR